METFNESVIMPKVKIEGYRDWGVFNQKVKEPLTKIFADFISRYYQQLNNEYDGNIDRDSFLSIIPSIKPNKEIYQFNFHRMEKIEQVNDWTLTSERGECVGRLVVKVRYA